MRARYQGEEFDTIIPDEAVLTGAQLVEAALGLKGLCGNMGGQVLAQRCAEVVKQGRAGVLEGIASSNEGIEAEF